jgi:hypothetical protein
MVWAEVVHGVFSSFWNLLLEKICWINSTGPLCQSSAPLLVWPAYSLAPTTFVWRFLYFLCHSMLSLSESIIHRPALLTLRLSSSLCVMLLYGCFKCLFTGRVDHYFLLGKGWRDSLFHRRPFCSQPSASRFSPISRMYSGWRIASLDSGFGGGLLYGL